MGEKMYQNHHFPMDSRDGSASKKQRLAVGEKMYQNHHFPMNSRDGSASKKQRLAMGEKNVPKSSLSNGFNRW